MMYENKANSTMGFKGGKIRDYKAPKTGLTPVPAGKPAPKCCSKGNK